MLASVASQRPSATSVSRPYKRSTSRSCCSPAATSPPAHSKLKRTVEVWHQGKRIEIARRVDALANCFVKRNHITRQLQVPKPDADDVPEGLSLRQLVDPSADLDDEGLF